MIAAEDKALASAPAFLTQKIGIFSGGMVFFEIGHNAQGAVQLVAAAGQYLVDDLLRNGKSGGFGFCRFLRFTKDRKLV